MNDTLPFSTVTYHTEPATKVEIINLVANYYATDPSRRGLKYSKLNPTATAGCVYATDDGHRCAIGLFLQDLSRISETDQNTSVDNWHSSTLDDNLLPHYKGHEQDFWFDLQQFHDEDKNFDHKGLSSMGNEALEHIFSQWA